MAVVKIEIELDEKRVDALRAYISRVHWDDIRRCARSDDETYEMLGGLEKIADAIGKAK